MMGHRVAFRQRRLASVVSYVVAHGEPRWEL